MLLYYILNSQHQIIGRSLEVHLPEMVRTLGGLVAQHVGFGPNGENLLHCTKCGAVFPENRI